MTPVKRITDEKASAELFRRTGIANGTEGFPKDFDEHFDDLNEEIAVMFYQEEKDKRGGTLYDGRINQNCCRKAGC